MEENSTSKSATRFAKNHILLFLVVLVNIVSEANGAVPRRGYFSRQKIEEIRNDERFYNNYHNARPVPIVYQDDDGHQLSYGYKYPSYQNSWQSSGYPSGNGGFAPSGGPPMLPPPPPPRMSGPPILPPINIPGGGPPSMGGGPPSMGGMGGGPPMGGGNPGMAPPIPSSPPSSPPPPFPGGYQPFS